jgi:hypothetical protein
MAANKNAESEGKHRVRPRQDEKEVNIDLNHLLNSFGELSFKFGMTNLLFNR